MSESRLARIGRDQLSTWLPALMMMLFALGTWWLVRSAPKFPTDGAAAVVSKEPDYFMNQFRVRDFDATGRLTSDLTGVEGHHYPPQPQRREAGAAAPALPWRDRYRRAGAHAHQRQRLATGH